jgi:Immunity protein 74
MFTIPRINVVASDEGFSVEVLGRTGIEYREGSKSAFVDSEVLVTGHGIAVFKDSIKRWRPPHDKELISTEERRRILDNIRRAIAFHNEPVQIL